jgi:PadR family transcriptional regulator PadR
MGATMGELERAVLLTVSRLGERAYGMAVRRELEERLNRSISIGAVYTTLDRMEEKGYVSSWIGEPTAERGGRAKKYFRVEAPGIEALNRSKAVFDALWALLPVTTK